MDKTRLNKNESNPDKIELKIMGQVQTSTGPFMNYPCDATSSDMPACQADQPLWHWTFNALMIEIQNNQNKKNPRFLAKSGESYHRKMIGYKTPNTVILYKKLKKICIRCLGLTL